MKKIIILFIILIPLKVEAISASAYIVMDSDNQRVLEGNNIHSSHLIASISKIMTSLVVINNTDLKKEVIINNEVLKSYGSGIYVEVGEKISIESLLYGLMLRSGNDAAIALAYEVGGSMEGFAKLMNDTARTLNMQNTIFLNSHGLEENSKKGNTSTVYDMAILSSYAISNDTYKKISGTKKYTVKTNYKTYIWNNKNKLLSMYENTTGGKTGYTELAKRTLVTNASKNNMNITIVTFKDGNDFNNHKNLYIKTFENYNNYKLLSKGNIKTNKKNTYLEKDVLVTLTDVEHQKVKTKYEYYKDNITNVVGEVQVELNGKIIKRENIYQKIEKVNNKISLWEKIKRKLGMLW